MSMMYIMKYRVRMNRFRLDFAYAVCSIFSYLINKTKLSILLLLYIALLAIDRIFIYSPATSRKLAISFHYYFIQHLLWHSCALCFATKLQVLSFWYKRDNLHNFYIRVVSFFNMLSEMKGGYSLKLKLWNYANILQKYDSQCKCSLENDYVDNRVFVTYSL